MGPNYLNTYLLERYLLGITYIYTSGCNFKKPVPVQLCCHLFVNYKTHLMIV